MTALLDDNFAEGAQPWPFTKEIKAGQENPAKGRSRLLLLFVDQNSCPRIFPVQIHVAAIAHFVERNGEVFHWTRSLGYIHVHARQVVAFILVRDAPLAGLLVNDQRPLVLVGNGENGVAAGGDSLAAYVGVGRSNQRSGLIFARGPNLCLKA